MRRAGSVPQVLHTFVPTTLDEVLDPGWLQQSLADVDEGDRIVAVEQVDASQTLAQKVRFSVTVERAGRGRDADAGARRRGGRAQA